VAESLLVCSRRAGRRSTLYDERPPNPRKGSRRLRGRSTARGRRVRTGAERALELCRSFGLGETPVCMAKTQSHSPTTATAAGCPTGFTLHVRDVLPSAGAGSSWRWRATS